MICIQFKFLKSSFVVGGDLKVHSWRRRVSLVTLGISSNNQRMLVPPASSCVALKCCFVSSVSRNFQGSEVLFIVCVDWLKSGKTSLEHKTEFKTKEFFPFTPEFSRQASKGI